MSVEFKLGHNNSHHVDEMKLDESEARYFVILFLEPEISRHLNTIKTCKQMIRLNADIPVVKIAWESSVKGHLEDIEATQKTINDIKKKWGWTNGEGK